MAKYHSGQVKIFIDQFELGTAMTEVSVMLQAQTLDPTSISDEADKALTGIRQDEFDLSGLFDDSNSYDAAAGSYLGGTSARVFTIYMGSATGSPAYAGTAFLISHRPGVSVRNLITQGITLQPNGTIDKCVLLFPKTSATGTLSSGNLDQSSTTTAGANFYTHILSRTGALSTGSLTLFLQEGPDATSLASFATHQYVTGMVGAQVSKATTGTVEAFVRAFYTSSTAGTAVFVAVFKRN